MAITTYSELKTAVQQWLHRSDLDAVIPTFVSLAESRINGDLDARFQDKKTDLATVAGVEYVAIPDDLISIRHASVETDNIYTLQYSTPDQFEKSYPYASASGIPLIYTIVGQQMYLKPIPDGAYTLDVVYKSRVPALSDAAPTNTLLTIYPNVYLYAVLLESAPYLKDDQRILVWENMYREAVQSVNGQDWYSGSTMIVKVDTRP